MRGIARHRSLRTLSVGLLAVMLTLGAAATAHAQDDEEDTFEQGLIRSFMRGMGLRDSRDPRNNLNYQERAPLVVPPTSELPPPEGAAVRTPNFPVDPEARKRAASRAKAAKQPKLDVLGKLENDMRQLSPAELEANGRAARTGVPTSASAVDPGRVEPSKDTIWTNNIFTSLWSKVGPQRDEMAVFRGEPERRSLTAPPAGYLTPSPAQPYGVVSREHPNAKANAAFADPAVGPSLSPQ